MIRRGCANLFRSYDGKLECRLYKFHGLSTWNENCKDCIHYYKVSEQQRREEKFERVMSVVILVAVGVIGVAIFLAWKLDLI